MKLCSVAALLACLLACGATEEEFFDAADSSGEDAGDSSEAPDASDTGDADGSDPADSLDARDGEDGVGCSPGCEDCCAAEEFCWPTPAGVCAATEGVCRLRPDACPTEGSPIWRVCGCDGRSWTSACEAYRQGYSGALVFCKPAGEGACDVTDTSSCEEGSACLTVRCSASGCSGACNTVADICAANHPLYHVCAHDVTEHCWASPCEAYESGFRGPLVVVPPEHSGL